MRGSHGQYTYYLDGAPLPSNVGGSFSDLINPKDIQTLRVYDGGFPAQYGGQLAAVFDVTTKGGHGRPNGFVQDLEQGYSAHQTTAEVGGSAGAVSYFASAIRHSSDFYLSPQTQTPLHDSGLETVGFGKIVYQARPDRPVHAGRRRHGRAHPGPQHARPAGRRPGRHPEGEQQLRQPDLAARHGAGRRSTSPSTRTSPACATSAARRT